MEYREKHMVADDRFSSHQARLRLQMGLRSLNVTYPTSSAEKKKTKTAERLANILVEYLTIISKESPNIHFFYSFRVSSPNGGIQDWLVACVAGGIVSVRD